MVKIRKMSVKKGSASVKKALKKSKSALIKSKEEKIFKLNSKELRINLEQLQKDAKAAYRSMMKVVPEAIKDLEIKKFGNASHIILPKKYSGKNIWIAFRDNKTDKIYIYPHDKALKFVEAGVTNKNVKFWHTKHRHWNTITKRNANFLKDYELK